MPKKFKYPSNFSLPRSPRTPTLLILIDFYGKIFRKKYPDPSKNPLAKKFMEEKKSQKKYALLSDEELRKLFYPRGIETIHSFAHINRVTEFSREKYNCLPEYSEDIFKE